MSAGPKQRRREQGSEGEKAELNVGGAVGGTRFDCFFIAIILALSSATAYGQSHHRSAQSFAYSPRFLYRACVSLSLSRRATRCCSRGSVGALRMHLLRGIPHAEKRITDRYLCTIASRASGNVTVIDRWIIDSSRSVHPRKSYDSSRSIDAALRNRSRS